MNNRSEIMWYELVFEQLQPIHIGKLNYGVIAETEIYIPGQTMWGALTKCYNIYNKANLNENQELFSLITCFFPSLDGKKVLTPFYKNGMFYIGEDITEDEFRFAYTDTFVSTAVKYLSGDAIDGSLHEIDLLLPQPKNELPEERIYKNENLKWIGLLGVEMSNENIISFLRENKLEINIGGDTRYGLGLLILKTAKKAGKQLLEGWNLNEYGELLLKNENNVLRNFMQINTGERFNLIGNIVPIAEFDFNNNNPIIKEASFYLSVGSSIYVDERNDSSLLGYKLSKGKFKKNFI